MVMDKSRLHGGGTGGIRKTSSVVLPVSTSASTLFRKEKRFNPYPLKDKDIVLDIENRKQYDSLKIDIRRLGGTVVDFISEDRLPYVVVSDHPTAVRFEKCKRGERDFVPPEFLRAAPLLLKDAYRNRIRIRSYATFQTQLAQAKSLVRTQTHSIVPSPPMRLSKSNSDGTSIRKLTPPFLKIQDSAGLHEPSFKEFTSSSHIRPLYVGKHFGQSLFQRITAEQHHKREREKMMEYMNNSKTPTLPKKPQRNNTQKSGFCDICGKQAEDMKMHFQSREHMTIISRPGFYDEVDALCGTFVDHIHCPSMPMTSRQPRAKQSSPLPIPADYPYSDFNSMTTTTGTTRCHRSSSSSSEPSS